MSQKKSVQKKALKKRKAVKEYPVQVATREDQVPMSDADFLLHVTEWVAFHSGSHLATAINSMIEATFDGKFSKSQYHLLERAEEAALGDRIPRFGR